MINEHFVFLGSFINLIGSLHYVLETIRGNTKPNRVTFFLWMALPFGAVAAELAEGVGLRSITTLSVGLGPALIFFSSFVNRNAYWKLTSIDYGCGAMSILAMLCWAATQQGVLAILLLIAADLLAGIPTLIKAFRYPETDNAVVFMLAIVNVSISLLTIKNWNVATYAFPLYILLFDGSMVVLIKWVNRRTIAAANVAL